MMCPRCGAKLAQTRVGELLIEGCNGCGGVWFANSELNAIARTQASQLKALDELFTARYEPRDEGRKNCPKCSVALFEFEFAHSPGIKLDGCPTCKGIWMDDGELQQMYNRIVEMQGATAPSAQAVVKTDRPLPTNDIRQKVRHASGFLSSVDCSSCGRRNPSVALACWACGTRLSKDRVALCPKCDVPMDPKTYFAVGLDSCPTCCGLWLQKEDVSKLLAKQPQELARIDAAQRPVGAQVSALWDSDARFLCPDCCKPMSAQQVGKTSGIRVDYCEKCSGVWVGYGKLKQIAEFYLKSGAAAKS